MAILSPSLVRPTHAEADAAQRAENRAPSSAGSLASRLGLDEIGFKGPSSGSDLRSTAVTVGKRLSKDFYVTYESSLGGVIGTIYVFYDLTQRLTLRGQAGQKSALDLIYTLKYD